jgi:hypothetical protein
MMTADRPTNGVTAYDMRHELTIVWPGRGHRVRAFRNGKELASWDVGALGRENALAAEVIEAIHTAMTGEFPYWHDPAEAIDHGPDREGWPKSMREWDTWTGAPKRDRSK